MRGKVSENQALSTLHAYHVLVPKQDC